MGLCFSGTSLDCEERFIERKLARMKWFTQKSVKFFLIWEKSEIKLNYDDKIFQKISMCGG